MGEMSENAACSDSYVRIVYVSLIYPILQSAHNGNLRALHSKFIQIAIHMSAFANDGLFII